MPGCITKYRLGLTLASISLMAFVQSGSSADETITAQITTVRASTVDTADRSTDSKAVAIKVHGDKARIEYPTSIVIYDSRASKVYFLDTAKKTYTVASANGTASGTGGGSTGGPRVEITVDAVKTSDTKSVNGTDVKRYTIAASAQSASSGGGRGGGFGGGRRHGGGFPGGGGGGGNGDGSGQASPRQRMTPIQVEGDYWLADAGSATLSEVSRKQIIAASILATLPDNRMALAFAQSIGQQIVKSKGFPMESRLTLLPPMRSYTGSYDSSPAGVAQTVEVTTSITSVAPTDLDASLFEVPTDYIEVRPQQP